MQLSPAQKRLAVLLVYALAVAALLPALILSAPLGAVAAVALGAAAVAVGGVIYILLAADEAATPEIAPAVEELKRRVEQLAARQEAIGRELGQARGEARQIFEALSEAGRAGAGMKDVLAEVRLLHRLVDQLQAREGAAAPAPVAPPPLAPPPFALPSGVEPVRQTPAVVTVPARDRPMLEVVQQALSAGRVDLVLQPIVTLPQRRRRFYECFSRIRDEDGALILPEQYLDVAADVGLLPAIDNLLLFRCIQMIRRARQRDTAVGFFCNVSRHSLADRDFLTDVSEFLQDNQDLAQNIILEIGQATLDLADDSLRLQMEGLTELGVRFSVDTVTTLPLDYARLADWHLKFVKVPAERFADTDPQGPWEGSLFQLRRMLSLHGIELIVEKIETDRQLVELLEFNIAYGQGYLFGEPKAAPDL